MLRLTKHAEESIEKRNIALDWINRAIAAADYTEADLNDPMLTRSFKAIDEAGRRILRVVHRPQGDDILVVTAHFDRSARR
jgi:Domain of unknown function (DUF4258)